MRGRAIALVVALAVVLWAPLAADAQQPERVRRIGVLTPSFPALDNRAALAWLRELGWVEGQTFSTERELAAGRDDRLPELARKLVGSKVDVIVTSGTPAVLAAKQATATIPIVMVVEGDPLKAGLVASLARPGGNVTGMTLLSPDLAAKRLQLLREAVPGVRRVAVLWNPSDPEKTEEWGEIRAAARGLGVELQVAEVRSRDEFEQAFQAAVRERAGAILVLSSPLTVSHANVIADLSSKNRLPAMYDNRWFVEPNGGLMSYTPAVPDVARRVAAYVDKILRGAKPADLPVEQPREFELIINLKAARALGLTIPKHILVRANKVIE